MKQEFSTTELKTILRDGGFDAFTGGSFSRALQKIRDEGFEVVKPANPASPSVLTFEGASRLCQLLSEDAQKYFESREPELVHDLDNDVDQPKTPENGEKATPLQVVDHVDQKSVLVNDGQTERVGEGENINVSGWKTDTKNEDVEERVVEKFTKALDANLEQTKKIFEQLQQKYFDVEKQNRESNEQTNERVDNIEREIVELRKSVNSLASLKKEPVEVVPPTTSTALASVKSDDDPEVELASFFVEFDIRAFLQFVRGVLLSKIVILGVGIVWKFLVWAGALGAMWAVWLRFGPERFEKFALKLSSRMGEIPQHPYQLIVRGDENDSED